MNPAVRRAAISVSLASLIGLAACGDGDTPSVSGSASEPDSAASPTDVSGDEDVVVVKGTSGLKFEPATLTATVGTQFNGRLVQVGSIPHNIAIEEFGVKPDDTFVSTPGESKAFSFTPDKPGSFDYVCTIHPATMKGTLTVT